MDDGSRFKSKYKKENCNLFNYVINGLYLKIKEIEKNCKQPKQIFEPCEKDI